MINTNNTQAHGVHIKPRIAWPLFPFRLFSLLYQNDYVIRAGYSIRGEGVFTLHRTIRIGFVLVFLFSRAFALFSYSGHMPHGIQLEKH